MMLREFLSLGDIPGRNSRCSEQGLVNRFCDKISIWNSREPHLISLLPGSIFKMIIVYEGVGIQCGGQRTTFLRTLLLPLWWILGIELRPLDLYSKSFLLSEPSH